MIEEEKSHFKTYAILFRMMGSTFTIFWVILSAGYEKPFL